MGDKYVVTALYNVEPSLLLPLACSLRAGMCDCPSLPVPRTCSLWADMCDEMSS